MSTCGTSASADSVWSAVTFFSFGTFSRNSTLLSYSPSRKSMYPSRNVASGMKTEVGNLFGIVSKSRAASWYFCWLKSSRACSNCCASKGLATGACAQARSPANASRIAPRQARKK